MHLSILRDLREHCRVVRQMINGGEMKKGLSSNIRVLFGALAIKRALTLIAVPILLMASLTTEVIAAAKIGIVDFENQSRYQGRWHLNSRSADMFTTELVKATKLDVFERKRIASILKEKDCRYSGRVDPSTAAEIGRLIGLDYVVTGAVTEIDQTSSGGGVGGFRISKAGYRAAVDIRIIDVQTGQIVFADSGKGKHESTGFKFGGISAGEKNTIKNYTIALRKALTEVSKKIANAKLESKLTSNKGVKVGDVVIASRLKCGVRTTARKPAPTPPPARKSVSVVTVLRPAPPPTVIVKDRRRDTITVSTRRRGNIVVDDFDEDALNKYYNNLKQYLDIITILAGLTPEQLKVQRGWARMSPMIGMMTSNFRKSQIELQSWPLSAKQEGWNILGKKLSQYNELFDEQRQRAINNKALSENMIADLKSIKLVTKKTLFQ